MSPPLHNKLLLLKLSQLFPFEELPLKLVARKRLSTASTYPTEHLTVITHTGLTRELFCKYSLSTRKKKDDFKGGLAYEIELYSSVLSRTNLPLVKYMGNFYFSSIHKKALVLEYAQEGVTLDNVDGRKAVLRSAEWIARFHTLQQNNVDNNLLTISPAHYLKFADTFEKQLSFLNRKYKYLTLIPAFYKIHLPALITSPKTIIHGEYYPKNILIIRSDVYPVDWESAAYAPGELDIATLTEGWDKRIIAKIKKAYLNKRKFLDNQHKKEFELRLLLAQIYFLFRWTSSGKEENLSMWLRSKKGTAHIQYIVERIRTIKIN